MNKKSIISNTVEGGLSDFLLQAVPVGIIVINNKLRISYRNGKGRRFLERHGLPGEVLRISIRIFEAFYSSRLNELFPGEIYVEKKIDRSMSKWLFRLHMVDRMSPRVVVFIMEEALPNQLSMNEVRLRHKLTRRETDVLRRVLKGLKNVDIAEELGISEQTVKDHLSNIYEKLGIENRNDLMGMFVGSAVEVFPEKRRGHQSIAADSLI